MPYLRSDLSALAALRQRTCMSSARRTLAKRRVAMSSGRLCPSLWRFGGVDHDGDAVCRKLGFIVGVAVRVSLCRLCVSVSVGLGGAVTIEHTIDRGYSRESFGDLRDCTCIVALAGPDDASVGR